MLTLDGCMMLLSDHRYTKAGLTWSSVCTLSHYLVLYFVVGFWCNHLFWVFLTVSILLSKERLEDVFNMCRHIQSR